jgi:integral membrane protein (TIGR01906 family)
MTGLSQPELAEATRQVQAYFHGGLPVSLVVQKEWGREPLFSAREQSHLADVRDLMNLAWRVQDAALAYVVLVGVGLIASRRAAGARRLARWLAAGAGFTVAIFVTLGLLALGDFESLWTQFHLLSFSNDLWLLDPRTDYLIRLYPVPFWFDAVTDLVVRSVGTALILLLLSLYALRYQRKP